MEHPSTFEVLLLRQQCGHLMLVLSQNPTIVWCRISISEAIVHGKVIEPTPVATVRYEKLLARLNNTRSSCGNLTGGARRAEAKVRAAVAAVVDNVDDWEQAALAKDNK
jgi:hypothetical protein